VAGVGGGTLNAFHSACLAGAIIAGLGTVCAWTLIRTGEARSMLRPV
jgi:hypothetical protein